MAETLLPIMLKVKEKRCVVVGGGGVAAQKVKQLLDCEASVIVVSPELCSELKELAEQGHIRWLKMQYEPTVLDEAFLVFSCTDDQRVNRQVSDDCNARRIFCNVVDAPELCDFYMPSVLRRGKLVISVSTSGNSPAFARKVRLFLESVVGDEFGSLVEILGEMRDEMRGKLKTVKQHRRFIDLVWGSEAWQFLREGDLNGAKACLTKCLISAANEEES